MFDKPIYSLSSWLRDFRKLSGNAPALFDAVLSGRVDGAFREKILLAVTAYNRCRYCGFVHSHWALRNKVSPEEIKALLRQDEEFPYDGRERTALEFARHFAITRGKPSEERIEQLQNYYGNDKAKDILVFLRMIFFANVSGNTFDAFLARLQGQDIPGSNPVFELVFFHAAAPILLPVLILLTLSRLTSDEPDSFMDAVPM